jgi:type III pantothenate kinase
MNNYVIAVDIGNTNTHIGLINYSSRGILSLDIFPSKEIPSRFINSVSSLCTSMKHAAPVPVVVSSVIGSVEEEYGDRLCRQTESPVFWIHYSASLPVKINYENPLKLGSDRLANFFYGHEVAEGRNLLIIDAGTAIKMDYLKKGKEFAGGIIIPGFSTQLESLHDHTDLLPSVNACDIGNEFPGLSTQSCMLSGVRYGIGGAVSCFVEKFRSHFNEDVHVLATGGSWKYLQEYMYFPFEFIPELTLVGCAMYSYLS